MLEHVWEQRGAARILLDGRTGTRLHRELAMLIQARLDAPATMAAMGAAAAQLTMLRLWVSGTVAYPAAELAVEMMACARLLPDRR